MIYVFDVKTIVFHNKKIFNEIKPSLKKLRKQVSKMIFVIQNPASYISWKIDLLDVRSTR